MLQQTLRTKVHLLQAPRVSVVTSYTRLFQSSQIRTFRSSTRLNTNEFTNVFATKVNKVEADVDDLKGDIKTLEYSMKAQLAKYALNQARQTSQLYFHSICGVSPAPYIIYQFLTRLRSWVLQCC